MGKSERHELAELLHAVGPDAPTLCDGWDAHDLAVHLRIRETDPLAAAGMVVKPLGGLLASRSARLREELGFDELVDLIEAGPQLPNPLAIAKIDERVNAIEYFVHHEDIRRAADSWQPRVLPGVVDDSLWATACTMARFRLARARVGVLFERVRDGLVSDERVVVATGPRPATLTATGAELVMWLYGRKSAAKVEFSGDQGSIEKLQATKLSI